MNKSSFALLRVEKAGTLKKIERKLAAMGLKIATVTRDWIGLQCFSMEREQIIAKNPAGKPATFVFSWGQLRESELSIVYVNPIVAVEIDSASRFPAGAWWFNPSTERITIEEFLDGRPIGTLVQV